MKSILRSLESLAVYQPLAGFLLRVLLFVYMLLQYWHRLINPSFTSEIYILALINVGASLLILIDFFTPRSWLTRLSALILIIVTFTVLITLLLLDRNINETTGARLLILGISFYLLTCSKKRPRRMDDEDDPLPLMMR